MLTEKIMLVFFLNKTQTEINKKNHSNIYIYKINDIRYIFLTEKIKWINKKTIQIQMFVKTTIVSQ